MYALCIRNTRFLDAGEARACCLIYVTLMKDRRGGSSGKAIHYWPMKARLDIDIQKVTIAMVNARIILIRGSDSHRRGGSTICGHHYCSDVRKRKERNYLATGKNELPMVEIVVSAMGGDEMARRRMRNTGNGLH